MEGKETRFGIATLIHLGDIHDGGFQWVCELHARQLYADRRDDTDAADAARRSNLRRNGMRTVRYAGICHPDGVYRGLMVGRTPEFLGKKIEPYEMKWAVLVCLATPIAILAGSGVAAAIPEVTESLNNPGAHGFSELLYAYSSAGGNNGSAFAGIRFQYHIFKRNTWSCHAVCKIYSAGWHTGDCRKSGRKKKIAVTAGTLSTTNAMFVFLLIFIVLLVGALSFFPALALGPVAEFVSSVV